MIEPDLIGWVSDRYSTNPQAERLMAHLRSTVIAKTDICGFTTRVKHLSRAELSDLLNQHKTFIANIIAKNEGNFVKGEGDSFWITFASVTSAALAAVEMQQGLRTLQSGKGDGERLAIRVAIAIGDVLHQDRDIFGDAVNLTARIEAITPPDEIYLSQAAWLALNKAEVQTSFVNEFSLKGMSEPERIYKIDQRHKTRIVQNQAIVVTDVRGFTAYQKSRSIECVEALLTHLDALEKAVCEDYGGTIRLIMGDAYLLTFYKADLALAAMEKLCRNWREFVREQQVSCGLGVGISKGDLYIFRSCIYGQGINGALGLEYLSSVVCPETVRNSVMVSEQIQEEVRQGSWREKLIPVQPETIAQLDRSSAGNFKKYLQDNNPYQLIVD